MKWFLRALFAATFLLYFLLACSYMQVSCELQHSNDNQDTAETTSSRQIDNTVSETTIGNDHNYQHEQQPTEIYDEADIEINKNFEPAAYDQNKEKIVPVSLTEINDANNPAHDATAPSSTASISTFELLEAVSTNSGINGIPDIPAAPSLVTLVEHATEIHIDPQAFDEEIDEYNSNNTQQAPVTTTPVSTPSSPIPSSSSSDIDAATLDVFNVIEEEVIATKSDIPVENHQPVAAAVDSTQSPNRIPSDGQVEMINDSGGGILSDGVTSENKEEAATTEGFVHPTQSPNKSAEENLTTVEESQIPLFSEWAQKRMQEAEKELEQDAANSSTMKKNVTGSHKTATVLKLRAKNYASPDCGAKIIAANAEAKNTREVLTSTQDEYLLSPCTSRIWFVVELCEAIQAEMIDLANFELFSSSPKNFSVAVSNRFPTREWSQVGRFIAKDERNIQSFDLFPHLFGKYVRVDIHSHYNSEHFCPISLFRVYGTSEFEAFETANRLNDVDDDDTDDEIEVAATKDDNNIFKSASDAVMSIVKKAAATFVKPSDNKTDAPVVMQLPITSTPWCMTPSQLVLCHKCRENLTADVTELLNCKQPLLNSLLSVDLIRNSIFKSQICANVVGLADVSNANCKNGAVIDDNYNLPIVARNDYITHMFPIRYVIAMCNLLVTRERIKNFKNEGFQTDPKGSGTLSNITIDKKNGDKLLLPPGKKNMNGEKLIDQDKLNENLKEVPVVDVNELRQTPSLDKAAVEIADNEQHFYEMEDIVSPTQISDDLFPTQIQAPPVVHDTISLTESSNEEESNGSYLNVENGEKVDVTASGEGNDDYKIPNMNELNEAWETVNSYDMNMPTLPTATTPMPPMETGEASTEETTSNGVAGLPQQMGQKVHSESVFLRLSNRVKALERNMSLSGQYLEELSRWYKKQLEERQTSFSKTLIAVEQESKRNIERNLQLYEEVQQLRIELDEIAKFFNLKNILVYAAAFACIQIGVMWIILRMWCRRNDPQGDEPPSVTEQSADHAQVVRIRRKSTDGSTGHIAKLTKKRRRPSEEALHIAGTYKDLLIMDDRIYDANPESEEYDNFVEAGRRKNGGKMRKNVKRAISLEPIGMRKKMLMRPDLAAGDFEKLKQKYVSSSSADAKGAGLGRDLDHPVLDEDYEVYIPGTDLMYNEFMPGGPSGQSTPVTGSVNGDATGDTSNSSSSSKKKTRRLSSPAFLKSPFSRSGSKGKSAHETATGWEWYKLKKDTTANSSQNKNLKKSKSESPPEVRANAAATTPTANGNGVNNNKSNSSRSSADSVRTSSSAPAPSSISDKKQGSFRRILKKVF